MHSGIHNAALFVVPAMGTLVDGAVVQLAEHHNGIAVQCITDSKPFGLSTLNGGVGMKEGVTLAEAARLTVERKSEANRRRTYIQGLKQYLELFSRGREGLGICAIKPSDIEDWFRGRHEKPATRASNLGRLSAMFSYAWRQGWVTENPCDKVERVSIERGVPQILTLYQVRQLLDVTRSKLEHMLHYLVLGLFVGLRPDEARQIQWSAVDLKRGTVTVGADITKTRRRRVVTMMPTAAAWLRECKEPQPLCKYHVRRWHWAVALMLGFDAWPQDILRHTSASYLLAEWRDAGKVAYQLGNSPGILMRHYMELVSGEDAKEFWTLRPPLAPPSDHTF